METNKVVKTEAKQRRARLAFESVRMFLPEFVDKDKETFLKVATAVASFDDETFEQICARAKVLGCSIDFIARASSDTDEQSRFMVDLWKDEKPKRDSEYAEGRTGLEDPYTADNLGKEHPAGNNADREKFMVDLYQEVRNQIKKDLPELMKDYQYPIQNIPVEASQSNNDSYIGQETQKLIDAVEKDNMERAETEAGGGRMGDGLVLYEEVTEKPTGYAPKATTEMATEEVVDVPVTEESVDAEEVVEMPMEDEMMSAGNEMVEGLNPEEDFAGLFEGQDEDEMNMASVTASTKLTTIPNCVLNSASNKTASNRKSGIHLDMVELFGEEF